MAILGVPDVVVLEPVDIHVQSVVRVEVHVGNEETCHVPSVTPSLKYSRD